MHPTTKQAASRFLMIKPTGFTTNAETLADNEFQHVDGEPLDSIQVLAMNEFEGVIHKLLERGVSLLILNPKNESTPDAVFPNNWFSLGPNHLLFLYPMKAESRAREVQNNLDHVLLQNGCEVVSTIDWTTHRNQRQFLEGTGSLVLDHLNKVAYLALSERSNALLAREWATINQYELVTFDTRHNELTQPVYHTNVLMAVLSSCVVICLDVIPMEQRDLVTHRIEQSGKKRIDITLDQMRCFCANILEINNAQQKAFVVMSQQAHDAFTKVQLKVLSECAEILQVSIPTIEKFGGGGIRCMLAELF